MFRYRALSVTGDYTFGRGIGNFYIDKREATAQSIRTRLGLWTGEWFLDNTAGTDWNSIVGHRNAKATADLVIRQRILGTFGVQSILGWWSGLTSSTRLYTAGAVVGTIWGNFLLSLAGTAGGTFQVNVSSLDGGDPLG